MTIRKLLTTVLTVLSVVVIICIGLIRTRFMLDAFYVALIPIVGSTAVLLIYKEAVLENFFSNKLYVLVSFIGSVIFMVMLSIEEVARMIIKIDGEIQHLIFKVLFLPVLFLSIYICNYWILITANSTKPAMGEVDSDLGKGAKAEDNNKNRFLGILKPTWILIVTMAYYVIAYFPGAPCTDLNASMMDKSPVFSDWHPLAWEYFLRIFAYIPKNWFGIVLAQSVFLVMAHNYVIKYLLRKYNNIKICYLYSILNITVGFIQFRFVPDMTKDTNFIFTMFFFVISAMYFIEKEKSPTRDYIILGVSAFLASSFRHTSFPVVMITMVVMFVVIELGYRNKKADLEDKQAALNGAKKRLLCAVAVIAAVGAAYFTSTEIIGFRILKAERNPEYVKYTVPMNVVGAMAFRNQEAGMYIPEDIIADMELIMPIEKWSDCYCSYDADVIARTWHKVGEDILKLNDKDMQKNLIGLNWYFLKHNPKEYILSFFDINSIVWEMSTPIDQGIYPVVCKDREGMPHMFKGAAFDTVEDTLDYVDSRPILVAITMRGGLALYVLMLAFVILIIKRSRLWVAIIPIMIYSASLMLAVPQSTYRFSMPITLFAILFGIVMFYEKNKKEI